MKRFDVGARVVEPTYGLGSVIAVEDAYTRVQFDEHGVKKFLTSMSRLEPSNEPVPAGLRGAKVRKKRAPKKAAVTAAPPPKTERLSRAVGPLLNVHRHPFAGRRHDRRPQRRLFLDRVEEIPHLAALVHDVVREEQAALVQPRIHHVEESLVVLLPRVEEDEIERARHLRDLLERVAGHTWTMSERPARLMLSASSFARTGSYSIVTSRPPVSRSPMPDPDRAVAAGAANLERVLAPLDATISRRNRPSSSETASWPLSFALMSARTFLNVRRLRRDAIADAKRRTASAQHDRSHLISHAIVRTTRSWTRTRSESASSENRRLQPCQSQ